MINNHKIHLFGCAIRSTRSSLVILAGIVYENSFFDRTSQLINTNRYIIYFYAIFICLPVHETSEFEP